MGNQECREVYRLGRDVGMIPDPQMDRTFTGYLSPDSSTHLSSHYMDVRSLLSPEQLGVFNHGLRATLGESGKVTQGGVVALALSFLFDVLAQQAKNQTGSTHFIHQIFREREGDHISEIGTVVSDYLKLVPLIANDPQRMKEETERYEQRLNHSLVGHFERTVKAQNSSWTDWKIFIHSLAFHQHMMIHQVRMEANIPQERLIERDWQKHVKNIYKYGPISLVEIKNVAERFSNISPENQLILTTCNLGLKHKF
ncbi:uncharacterized protein LOC118226740 [Anguilla anguilla]|uniref:uncharacterized protein LOC118226740 n=1 Tax=Anguilla anguilla TaxID=7936 RepID=UPI0015AD4917|nr:uncharacterized protein LOC118226740 [Anguilla anguilla]